MSRKTTLFVLHGPCLYKVMCSYSVPADHLPGFCGGPAAKEREGRELQGKRPYRPHFQATLNPACIFRVSTFPAISGNLEMSENSALVSKKSVKRRKVGEKLGNLCSWGNLIVAARQNAVNQIVVWTVHELWCSRARSLRSSYNLLVFRSYCNSFFMHDIHGQFGLINAHFVRHMPLFRLESRAGSWSLRALRLESNCGPLVKINAILALF